MKAVNAWFQNKRRTLKKTWSASCGWSKGSLPENKHVRPPNGLKTLPHSDAVISLERVASSHELPYKGKGRGSSLLRIPGRVSATPKRLATTTEVSREIWELLPSSPPTRPSSPSRGEPLLALEPCKRLRTLEWACANARAVRKASIRRARRAAKAADSDDDSDVPMLILDATPHKTSSSGDDTETEEDEAITPNVSTELLPAFILPVEADELNAGVLKLPGKGKDMDMEAAIALLGFTTPGPTA